ncbi:MAG: PAS domain S-box protein [Chloroflexota bacterium]
MPDPDPLPDPFAADRSSRDLDRARSDPALARAYEDLAAAEARYRLLAENAADVVAHADAQGVYTWISPSIERILGWTPAELVGRPIAGLLHPDDVAALRGSGFERRPVEVRGRVRGKDGAYRWMASRSYPLFGVDGTPVGFVSAVRDIDAEVVAEERARESELSLRAALDSMLDPYAVMEAIRDAGGAIVDFRYRYANEAACAWFELAPERLIGARLLELIPGERGLATVARYARAVEAQGPILLDDHLSDSGLGGAGRTYDVRAVAVGERVSLTWRDVTERTRAVAELAESRAQLAEAQRIAHVGSWYWDPGTDTVRWSDEHFRLYGLEPGSPAASWAEQAAFIEPESRRNLEQLMARALAGGQAYEAEIGVIRADGDRRRMVTRTLPAMGEAGAVVGLHGTLTDITDITRARDELAELAADLEQRVEARTAELRAANEELEAFTYTVSHDLRSPVRAIAGFARLLQRSPGTTLDDSGRHRLENIASSAETMGQLIDDLLRFTRVGRREIRREPVALGPIVARLQATHAETLAETGGRLELVADGAVPLADPTLLEEILLNLVNNAIAYRRPEVPPLVAVSAVPAGSEVIVSVEDNGRGIPPESREKVFEVFTRSGDDHDGPHAGIGLATVRRAARAMGSDVAVASEVGVGSTFSLVLPRA